MTQNHYQWTGERVITASSPSKKEADEGEKNHKKGGLNCIFENFFFYILKNCSQVQSLK